MTLLFMEFLKLIGINVLYMVLYIRTVVRSEDIIRENKGISPNTHI